MVPQTWSVIIFCYNEKETVQSVFYSVLNILQTTQADFEVIIVDDGSKDGSVDKIHQLHTEFPKIIKPVYHSKNLGIGSALRSGYTASQYENVCAVPADGQFDVKELMPYLNFDDKTFISFYRKENMQYTLFRNILSIVNKKINSYFIGIDLHDVNWLKAYKSKEIKSFDWKIKSSLIESELCAKLLVKKNKVIEVVSVYHPRQAGNSKGASLKIVVQALKETFRLILIMYNFKKKNV